MDDVSSKLTPSILSVSKDEDRLVALYSPMRPKNLNPENWDRKTKFWATAIEEVIDRRITFTMKELQEAFTITNRVPACLPDVIHHLHNNKEIAPVQDLLHAANKEKLGSIGWNYWPVQSIRWCAEKMNILNPLTYLRAPPMLLTTDRYVYVRQLKHYSDKVLSLTKLQNKLMSVPEWKKEIIDLTQLEKDEELLFTYMKESGKIALDTIGSVEVIKMSSNPSKEIAKISDVEKKEYEVRKTKERLEVDLENLYQKQKDLDSLLRLALQEGKKMTAKHHLRSKKLLEKRTEKLLMLVDNLSSLLLAIEDATSDALIILAYESGKKAIDMIFKENNLTPDRAIETMLDVQDVLEKQNEISESLSFSNFEDSNLSELDRELELLLKEDQQKGMENDPEEVLEQLQELNLDDVEDLVPDTRKGGKGKSNNNDGISINNAEKYAAKLEME